MREENQRNGNGALTIEQLEALLPRAVLLPIPQGWKRPKLASWASITFDAMQNPSYRRSLNEHTNTGVLLGRPSENLCAIDADSDEAADLFLALNPSFKKTLRSKGKRGCQFWVNVAGHYPHQVHKLKTCDGKAFGEWRADGGQSVIRGVHPEGGRYRLLCDAAPLRVNFDAICWPSFLVLPWREETAKLEHRTYISAEQKGLSERIRAYLAKADPAISGQDGHGTTFRVACTLVWGFGLDPDRALPFLNEYNGRCQPPWDAKQLQHKLDDALTASHEKPRGYLLKENFEHSARKREGSRGEAHPGNTASRKSAGTKTRPRLILPGGSVAIIETAGELFSGLSGIGKYFVRGRLIVELARNKEGSEVLTPLRATALRTRIEEDFELWVWRSLRDQTAALKRGRCPKDIAEALLESNSAVDLLPGIQLLTSAPILAERHGTLIILNRGYHDYYGGVFVECRTDVPEIAVDEAKSSLLNLLSDFDFTTKSDLSRAVAGFISPALRFGRLLDADFPLDLAEADQSQSGKTYRQLLVSALYKETSYVVTRRERGVGSLDESISSALLSGRPFIAIENVRGVLDSQILESALRGHGHVNVRVPHKGEVQLKTDHVCWQLSSNQAATTRDLANRCIVTRIRKQKLGYQYKAFPEGDLLTHIKANQAYYLGCVFAVIRAWHQAAKPKTTESRHDFREWCQTLDWIVQNLFQLAPLLDGHREEQERISNPHLNWLRDVAICIDRANELNNSLRVAELVDICTSNAVELPGHRNQLDERQQIMLAGKIMSKLFHNTEILTVGGYKVTRIRDKEYNIKQRKEISVNRFCFERL